MCHKSGLTEDAIMCHKSGLKENRRCCCVYEEAGNMLVRDSTLYVQPCGVLMMAHVGASVHHNGREHGQPAECEKR